MRFECTHYPLNDTYLVMDKHTGNMIHIGGRAAQEDADCHELINAIMRGMHIDENLFRYVARKIMPNFDGYNVDGEAAIP